MDNAALVTVDLDRGAEMVEILERAKVKFGVALWAYLSEYDDWRLVLAARRFDALTLRDAYGLLHELLDAAGIAAEKTPATLILPMSDPFVKELRRIFGKARSVEGMRLGGQTVGNRFLEDAYVYRIS